IPKARPRQKAGCLLLSRVFRGAASGNSLRPSVDPSDEAPAAFDIAVTGGTGDFKDARGWIRSTPDGDHSRLEFHLTR
ncbi:hypothetical protein ACFWFX_37380, partial [Streptomyces roseolus]